MGRRAEGLWRDGMNEFDRSYSLAIGTHSLAKVHRQRVLIREMWILLISFRKFEIPKRPECLHQHRRHSRGWRSTLGCSSLSPYKLHIKYTYLPIHLVWDAVRANTYLVAHTKHQDIAIINIDIRSRILQITMSETEKPVLQCDLIAT